MPQARTRRTRTSGDAKPAPASKRRSRAATVAPLPKASARRAGLRYVSDETSAGIRRVKAGKGFRYVRGRGGRVRDAATLGRIRSLVIPPAWTDVWICPSPQGHLQATGRDARG